MSTSALTVLGAYDLINLTEWCLLCLQGAENNWQFDIFALADATPGNTLSLLAFYLFGRAGFIQQFNLDEGKLCCFLQRIEKGYDASNPYHNRCAVLCLCLC